MNGRYIEDYVKNGYKIFQYFYCKFILNAK